MSSTIGETPPQQVSLPQSVSNLERKHLERKHNRITAHTPWGCRGGRAALSVPAQVTPLRGTTLITKIKIKTQLHKCIVVISEHSWDCSQREGQCQGRAGHPGQGHTVTEATGELMLMTVRCWLLSEGHLGKSSALQRILERILWKVQRKSRIL